MLLSFLPLGWVPEEHLLFTGKLSSLCALCFRSAQTAWEDRKTSQSYPRCFHVCSEAKWAFLIFFNGDSVGGQTSLQLSQPRIAFFLPSLHL